MSSFILSFLLHGCIEISAIWRLRLAGLAFALIGSSQLVSSSHRRIFLLRLSSVEKCHHLIYLRRRSGYAAAHSPRFTSRADN